MRLSYMFVSKKTEDMIRALYSKAEADRRIRIFGRKKAIQFIFVSAITILISVPVFLYDRGSAGKPVVSLARNGYGEGEKTVTLKAVTDGFDEKITVNVDEIRYSDEELRRMSEKLDKDLWKIILAGNTDAGNITEDLDLKNKIEGYPFEITWKTDDPLLVSSKGIINADRQKEEDPNDEGLTVSIRATLKYKQYTEDKYSYIIVHKKNKTIYQTMQEELTESIEESGKASGTKPDQILPKSVNGRKITFYNTSVNRGYGILFTGLMSAFFLMAVKDRKIKDEADNRRKQMEADYPNILNQYALYFAAGMNPRAIWCAICSRYEDNPTFFEGRRYAYEEMITTKRLMDEGCNEITAYDAFAARCQNVRYRTFISFVKQAVVKGGDSLGSVLYEEMEKAREEKNNLIKTAAAEAETKMLLPMFMMLTVVLMVVMVPAFIGLDV